MRSRYSRRQFVRDTTGAVAGLTLTADALAQPSAGAAPGRVIIDTDPGVDDALALLLAMRSPELRIEGITPVAGNVPLELTLPNALRMVEIAGRREIPVAPGAKGPLRRKLITAAYAHGENGLGGVPFPAPTLKPVSETASELIRRLVRQYPQEITILAIGPLTNLALALREDPALASRVRAIYLMGGSLSGGNITPAAEFNCYVDPEAAREVFRSKIPIVMVGLDVTRKALVREQHIQQLASAGNPAAEAAGKILRAVWNRMQPAQGRGGPAMHDSVAVAALLDPTLVRLQPYQIEVETAGEFTAGETLGCAHAPVRRSAPEAAQVAPPAAEFQPNARVAMDLDVDRFFQLLIGRLTARV